MIWTLHSILLPLTFLTGTLVGSFSNVCIYRLPWEKSVIWPPSCCPRCLTFIRPTDNVPILGYLRLGGRCRTCGLTFSGRYAAIELLVGLLFVGVYAVDVMAETKLMYGDELLLALSRAAYHACLVTLLVVATFIDYDFEIIPDSVTITGMVIALAVGTLMPEIRLAPAQAQTNLGGLGVGVLGLLIGGAVIYAVRLLGWVLFRKEAMGLGDVTLVGMIGSFLGWQVTPLILFLGALVGLGHGGIRLGFMAMDWFSGRPVRTSGIPFGPYLSLAALILMFGWRWFWPGGLEETFQIYGEVFVFLVGSLLDVVVGGSGG